MRKRGQVISVPDGWIDSCRQWRRDERLTIDETGARLARAVRRGRPFAEATVRRYLRGAIVTDELTRAFARVMGVLPPVTIEDQEHQEWHDLGVRLDGANARLFRSELERLRELVRMAEALRDDESE